jgi:hypothetical protein
MKMAILQLEGGERRGQRGEGESYLSPRVSCATDPPFATIEHEFI